jgi:tetratricopeptide (TPR) repeat protein
MENLPVYARLYADRVLLVVVLILLVIVIIRWRINANVQREMQVANDLATARGSLERLEQFVPLGPPDQLASERGQLIGEVTQGIDNVANNSSDKDTQLRAQALVTRGNLYWTLANLPPISGAATQPLLALPKTSDEYLQSAQDSYQQVISSYPNEKDAVIAANFGLGAIDENRHQWADAQRIYEQIENSDADKMYKDLAGDRIKLLGEMEKPLFFGTLTSRPTTAESQPLVFAPPTSTESASSLPNGTGAIPLATRPATAPTTRPAEIIVGHPTTQPTVQPTK